MMPKKLNANPFDWQMMIVKRNLEQLYSRPHELGYTFNHPDDALPGPDLDVEAKLRFLENSVGRLPLALTSFYRIVGSVDFTGSHEQWIGCDYPDPVVVEPIGAAVGWAAEWMEWGRPGPEDGPYVSESGAFIIPIAPDYYHKEDESGGMFYHIAVPSHHDDPLLVEERHETTLVECLRLSCRWGGFPGLERCGSDHTWPIKRLRAGLLDF